MAKAEPALTTDNDQPQSASPARQGPITVFQEEGRHELVPDQEAPLPRPRGPEGDWRDGGAAGPRCDDFLRGRRGPARVAGSAKQASHRDGNGPRPAPARHGHRREEETSGAPAAGRTRTSTCRRGSLSPPRALPQRHHHRQQYRPCGRPRRSRLPERSAAITFRCSARSSSRSRIRSRRRAPDVHAGTSLDQNLREEVRAGHARFRRCSSRSRTSTQAGGCTYGYFVACIPTRSAGRRRSIPLPMVREPPRVVFRSALRPSARPRKRARREPPFGPQHPSTWVSTQVMQLRKGAGRQRPRGAAEGLPRETCAKSSGPHPAGRGAQRQRRTSARAARRADGRPRLVRRARQADDGPAGGWRFRRGRPRASSRSS